MAAFAGGYWLTSTVGFRVPECEGVNINVLALVDQEILSKACKEGILIQCHVVQRNARK